MRTSERFASSMRRSLEHDPKKVADFLDKIMRNIKGTERNPIQLEIVAHRYDRHQTSA
jgi:hypothetical protein